MASSFSIVLPLDCFYALPPPQLPFPSATTLLQLFQNCLLYQLNISATHFLLILRSAKIGQNIFKIK